MIDFSKYNKFREEAIKASQSPVEDLRCDFTTFMYEVKRLFKDTQEHAFSDMQVKFTYPLEAKAGDGRNFNLYFFGDGEATNYIIMVLNVLS